MGGYCIVVYFCEIKQWLKCKEAVIAEYQATKMYPRCHCLVLWPRVPGWRHHNDTTMENIKRLTEINSHFQVTVAKKFRDKSASPGRPPAPRCPTRSGWIFCTRMIMWLWAKMGGMSRKKYLKLRSLSSNSNWWILKLVQLFSAQIAFFFLLFPQNIQPCSRSVCPRQRYFSWRYFSLLC